MQPGTDVEFRRIMGPSHSLDAQQDQVPDAFRRRGTYNDHPCPPEATDACRASPGSTRAYAAGLRCHSRFIFSRCQPRGKHPARAAGIKIACVHG